MFNLKLMAKQGVAEAITMLDEIILEIVYEFVE